MDNKTIHDLAVAYAQAKLIQHQQMNPDENGYDEEIKLLIKSYYHACNQIPIEDSTLDDCC